MNLTQSTFSKYTLSESDTLIASTLTTLTSQFIQNQICSIAEAMIALDVDPNNYSAYVQQQAYLKGQMDGLKYLLDASIASEAAVLEAARKNSQP